MAGAADLFMMNEIAGELERARAKFQSSDLAMVALMEEVGELARALLDESPDRVRAEAVQVAAMAIRVATEGDPTIEPHRERRGLGRVR